MQKIVVILTACLLRRADEDKPFTYAFDTVDLCTKTVRNLDNPIPTANVITTALRYDLGKPCAHKGEREIIVVGAVTDRLGAQVSLCDRSSSCPSVILALIPKLEPKKIIDRARLKVKQNKITSLQAIDELMLAMQARQRQSRQGNTAGPKNNTEPEQEKQDRQEKEEEQEQELLTVLSMVASAANETLTGGTPRTPRVQGV